MVPVLLLTRNRPSSATCARRGARVVRCGFREMSEQVPEPLPSCDEQQRDLCLPGAGPPGAWSLYILGTASHARQPWAVAVGQIAYAQVKHPARRLALNRKQALAYLPPLLPIGKMLPRAAVQNDLMFQPKSCGQKPPARQHALRQSNSYGPQSGLISCLLPCLRRTRVKPSRRKRLHPAEADAWRHLRNEYHGRDPD